MIPLLDIFKDIATTTVLLDKPTRWQPYTYKFISSKKLNYLSNGIAVGDTVIIYF